MKAKDGSPQTHPFSVDTGVMTSPPIDVKASATLNEAGPRSLLRSLHDGLWFLLLVALVFVFSTYSRADEDPFAGPVCDGPPELRYSADAMRRKIALYQVLSEEALSLRSESITYLAHLKEKQTSKEPLLGSEIRLLSVGASELVKKRQKLWQVATAHECWLDEPVPDDPQQAHVQAVGITMSLAAALTLYDNYLTAVALYREDPFLRHHINEGDTGFQVPEGELRRIAASYASVTNRARVRRGLIWYERHAGDLARSQIDEERYLAELVEQSPSYAMVRRIRPLTYANQVIDLIGTISIDTLHSLQSEGVNFSSMVFGNMVGLVESRRGKLDARQDVLDGVADKLQAGDVLLEKTPFRLTDSFIPGHWGHAAVWVGTEAELRELELWDHPVVVAHHEQIRRGRGVVEALRSGVEMNSLEHFMNVDDLAVLHHPNLDPQARRRVILQTLRQVGKAYDFNFDAQSANRIVCSELVYHAYGDVHWPTERKLGRVVVSPDNIAQEAVGDGVFDVALLYHDGVEIDDGAQQQLAKLIEPRVVTLAHSGLSELNP
ncbi:MAG: YiiX/YebB-like N1pC/P60 family cysteine hydrolase [Candidatus Thiodiazotropha sp.]